MPLRLQNHDHQHNHEFYKLCDELKTEREHSPIGILIACAYTLIHPNSYLVIWYTSPFSSFSLQVTPLPFTKETPQQQ
jgi:hypothetical protein